MKSIPSQHLAKGWHKCKCTEELWPSSVADVGGNGAHTRKTFIRRWCRSRPRAMLFLHPRMSGSCLDCQCGCYVSSSTTIVMVSLAVVFLSWWWQFFLSSWATGMFLQGGVSGCVVSKTLHHWHDASTAISHCGFNSNWVLFWKPQTPSLLAKSVSDCS